MTKETLIKLLNMSEEEANNKIKDIIITSKTTADVLKKIKNDKEIKNKIFFAYIVGLTLVQEGVIDV